MNKSILGLAFVLVFSLAARADFSVDADVRYGLVDTGISTKSIASPEISLRRDFGESGAHSIGLAYVSFRWSDYKVWKRTPQPGEADFVYETDDSGRVRWNVLFLDYRYSIPISKSWSMVLSPRIGAAKFSESGTITAFGGLIGGPRTESYTADSAWRLAAEAQACLKWHIGDGWHAQCGIAYTRVKNGNSNLFLGTFMVNDDSYRPLAKSISSIQGELGVSYTF